MLKKQFIFALLAVAVITIQQYQIQELSDRVEVLEVNQQASTDLLKKSVYLMQRVAEGK